MSFEQLKREVTALNDRERAELIRYTLQLRHEHDAEYRREVTDRLNDRDKFALAHAGRIRAPSRQQLRSMRPYAIYINEAALASAPRSGVQREKLAHFIRSLADNPNASGDFSEKDNAGRIVQVKIIGRYAVTFWSRHSSPFQKSK